MPTRRKGARILGPYRHGPGFRCREVDGAGEPNWSETFPTKEEAEAYKKLVEEAIATRQLTTDDARDAYLEHQRAEGNRETSIKTTEYALKAFFPEPLPLWGLREKHCQERYEALVEATKTANNKDGEEVEVPRYAADTHRNYLAQVKACLGWCVEAKMLRENPAADIKGTGKRNRGKPQLRIRHARAWYRKALELAEGGDDGAVAALVALLLGLRASEICRMRAGDLDEDELPGDTLWIDKSKTRKGERTLEIPETLRPLLLALAEGKGANAWLFPTPLSKSGRHERGWPLAQARRIAIAAKLPPDVAASITAHGLRGMLASISFRRGAPGELVADVLGHEDQRTSREVYAEEGAADAGDRRRGLKVLEGGKG